MEPRTEITLEVLQTFADQIKDDYPNRKDRNVAQFRLDIAGPTSSHKQDGYVLTDVTAKHIVQMRLDAISLSVLPPYVNWDKFSGHAKVLLGKYVQTTKPQKITRIAVRYINRIDIPLPVRDFRDYLRTYPEVSSDMEPFISGFFMQLHSPQKDIEAVAVVNECMVPAPRPEVVSILLDIDLFRTDNLPQEENELWQVFEKLRERKNQIFQASLTHKTKELFN